MNFKRYLLRAKAQFNFNLGYGMYRALLAALLVTLFWGCSSHDSGGRSSSSATTAKPEPTTSGERFHLGGLVSGLQGQLILSNGIDGDFAIILQPGAFVFPNTIPAGELYNIRIEAKPEDHLCEIANSRNFLIRDTANVLIRCAKVVERQIEIVRPANIALDRMLVSSNYQRIGVGESEPLVEDDERKVVNNRLRVFDNSFVSVSVLPVGGSVPEPIYLAHINDMTEYLATSPENLRKPIVLNEASTIRALVLMEPTMATALLERVEVLPSIGGLHQLMEDIFSELESTAEYSALKVKIHTMIAAQKSLTSNDGELSEPLQAVIRKIVNILLNDPAYALPRPVFEQSVLASGVEFSPTRVATENTGFDVKNNTARVISVTSAKTSAMFLRDFDSRELLLSPGISAQESVTFTMVGPGGFGLVDESNRAVFAQAVVRSGLEQHFFAALDLMLGIQSPESFKVYECFDEEQLAELISRLIKYVHGELGVSEFAYSTVYRDLFDAMRGQLGDSADNPSLLEEFFACDKFGSGIYFEDKLHAAIAQVKALLQLSRQVYPPDLDKLDLMSYPALTFLTASIWATNVETRWTYSNSLTLKVIADRSVAAPEQEIHFQVECIDPAVDDRITACDVEWEFGDGFKLPKESFAGGISQVKHRYPNAGEFQIKVTASRVEGVSVTQTINVTVREPVANITVTKPNGTPLANGDLLFDYRRVLINRQAKTTFRLNNSGTADLVVASITSNNPAFSLDVTAITIPPGQSKDISLYFLPDRVRNYSADITLLNNSGVAERQTIVMHVQGAGDLPGDPAEGAWTVVQNEQVQEFVVQRARVDALPDGGLLVRIFAGVTTDLPQIILNIPAYQALTEHYLLDDTLLAGCLASITLDKPENTYCTNTSELATEPFTGTVDVLPVVDGKRRIRYAFTAAQNSVACGSADVALCPVITVQGELIEIIPK